MQNHTLAVNMHSQASGIDAKQKSTLNILLSLLTTLTDPLEILQVMEKIKACAVQIFRLTCFKLQGDADIEYYTSSIHMGAYTGREIYDALVEEMERRYV